MSASVAASIPLTRKADASAALPLGRAVPDEAESEEFRGFTGIAPLLGRALARVLRDIQDLP